MANHIKTPWEIIKGGATKAADLLTPRNESRLERFDSEDKTKDPDHISVPHFMDFFLNSVLSQDEGGKAVIQLRRLLTLNLAVAVSELHAGKKHDAIARYYHERGVGRIEDLDHYELITERHEKSGNVGSILEKAVLEAIKLLPDSRKLIKFIQKNDVTLEDILIFVYKENNAFQKVENQKEIRRRILQMADLFDQLLEANPELKALLKEIQKRILAGQKENYQAKSERDPDVKEDFGNQVDSVKHDFEARAMEAKNALEQIYRLKSLNGRQAVRFILSENNSAERDTVLSALGLSTDELMREFYDQEVSKKINAAREAHSLPEDFDKKQLPSGDPKSWIKFLADDVMGKKIAVALNIDFTFFSKKLSKSCGQLAKLICPIAQSEEAGSFEDLAKKIALAGNTDVASYIAIAVASRKGFLGVEQNYGKGLWSALAHISKIPAKQVGDPKEVVKKIAKELKNRPEYSELEGGFNRLCHAALDHYQTEGKGAKPNLAKGAVDKCMKAMDPVDEGFNKDFLALMPIADKNSINFKNFDNSYGAAEFSLDHLLSEYAKTVKEQGLVDLTFEIENDIFRPLLAELGLQIPPTSNYSPENPLYLSAQDFAQAKKMGEGIRELAQASFKSRNRKEGVEDESKKKTPDTKAKLSEADIKMATAYAKEIRERLAQATKPAEEPKRDDKDKKK